MGLRQAFHLVVESGSWQQDLRRALTELQDQALFQPGQFYCASLRLTSGGRRPRWVRSTADLRPAQEKPKRLPRPPESWRLCFTTHCASACPTRIPEPPIMNSVIASECFITCSAAHKA